MYLQVCTGKIPYNEDYKSADVARTKNPTSPPDFDNSLDSDYREFIEHCITEDPKSRPTAGEVLGKMVEFLGW